MDRLYHRFANSNRLYLYYEKRAAGQLHRIRSLGGIYNASYYSSSKYCSISGEKRSNEAAASIISFWVIALSILDMPCLMFAAL